MTRSPLFDHVQSTTRFPFATIAATLAPPLRGRFAHRVYNDGYTLGSIEQRAYHAARERA